MRASKLIRANQRPDTAEDIANRIRRNRVLAQVRAEVEARFPEIDSENISEVLAFQERRVRELGGDR